MEEGEEEEDDGSGCALFRACSYHCNGDLSALHSGAICPFIAVVGSALTPEALRLQRQRMQPLLQSDLIAFAVAMQSITASAVASRSTWQRLQMQQMAMLIDELAAAKAAMLVIKLVFDLILLFILCVWVALSSALLPPVADKSVTCTIAMAISMEVMLRQKESTATGNALKVALNSDAYDGVCLLFVSCSA